MMKFHNKKQAVVRHEPVEVDAESPEELSTDPSSLTTIPWRYKWTALLCFITLPIGHTWTGSALGPLKNTLREELGITNAQFGVISSADAFVNTVFPIIGGIILDWYGPNIVTLCCTNIVLVGSVIAAAGVQVGLWRVLVAGHVLMGFGIAVLDSATQKLFYHWFGASGLALAFGLESALSSTVGLVSGMVTIPIRDNTGWYGWVFWIPVAFCGFSVAMNVIYVCFERFVVPREYRLTEGKALALSQTQAITKRNFSWKIPLMLPWAYLMLPATQLLQSGAAGGFSTSSADIIFMKGYTEEVAGYLSTAQRILPIILSPVLGLAIDRYGHRFHYVALAPLLWIIACSMLGFTNVHPLAALVFASLAGVINSMPLQVCIPLLVGDQAKIGTAFGVWRAFNNSGSTLIDVIFGVVQDGTADGGYSRVLLVAIGIKVWAFILGLSYIVIDSKFLGKVMTLGLREREAREALIEDKSADPLTKRETKAWFTTLTFSLLVAIIASAWAVFLRYLI